jgi:hypothetical protein
MLDWFDRYLRMIRRTSRGDYAASTHSFVDEAARGQIGGGLMPACLISGSVGHGL